MLNTLPHACRDSAQLLKGMAHPVRLQLLALLANGEACVCHLTAQLGQRQPYVSQQLAFLREAGCLEDRKEGLRVYYRIANPRVLSLLQALRLPAEMRATGGCSCPQCSESKELR